MQHARQACSAAFTLQPGPGPSQLQWCEYGRSPWLCRAPGPVQLSGPCRARPHSLVQVLQYTSATTWHVASEKFPCSSVFYPVDETILLKHPTQATVAASAQVISMTDALWALGFQEPVCYFGLPDMRQKVFDIIMGAHGSRKLPALGAPTTPDYQLSGA